MAAAAMKVSGTTVHIGTTADVGATDTYTEIKRARVVGGSIGGAWSMADSTAVSDTVKQTTKTILDPGDVDLDINDIPDDAGQSDLRDAYDDEGDVPYNVEVRFPQGDKWRLKVKVSQWAVQVGNATALRTVKAKLMLTAAPTYVPAA